MKVKFDPKNANHLKAYEKFRKERSWGDGCKFELEWPFMSIPDMIVSKLIDTHLKSIIRSL